MQEDLIPHVPLLILFTTSAQTHIFPEIRIDAVRFLDLFLELVPENVVDNWIQGNPGHGKRVLEGYLGILNAGTKYGDTEGKSYNAFQSRIASHPTKVK
jgi:pre-rRNA-processing protein IPI1